jgi:hypothetical protein
MKNEEIEMNLKQQPKLATTTIIDQPGMVETNTSPVQKNVSKEDEPLGQNNSNKLPSKPNTPVQAASNAVITLPTLVPNVQSPIQIPQSQSQTQLLSSSLILNNRQGTSLSMNGTSSEMSMATVMTTLDNFNHNTNGSPQVLLDEIHTLKNELDTVKKNSNQIKTDFKQVQNELIDLKMQHDDQMKKMQRKLFDLINEIDEEKKTRLALQVELERIKKTLMNNL